MYRDVMSMEKISLSWPESLAWLGLAWLGLETKFVLVLAGEIEIAREVEWFLLKPY